MFARPYFEFFGAVDGTISNSGIITERIAERIAVLKFGEGRYSGKADLASVPSLLLQLFGVVLTIGCLGFDFQGPTGNSFSRPE